MSNCKHPHRPARHAGRRDAWRTADFREGMAWARHPPMHLFPVQAGKHGGNRVEGLEGGFTGAAEPGDLGQLGTAVQQQEGFQPDTRKDFLD